VGRGAYAMTDFGVCGGALAQADFRTIVECAGQAGFRFVSLWPRHFDEALASGLSVADMRALLQDHDVSVSELDPLCTWLPIEPEEAAIAADFYRYSESDFFRVADALGARSLNVIQMGAEGLAREAVVDALGTLCEKASRHGLVVSVEFMAWSPIRDLQNALSLVHATGRPDCGVNIDTWHHFRTGGSVEDLRALTASEVMALQLSDVEVEVAPNLLEETAGARRVPGEGAATARDALAALGEAGVDVPITVEVFSDEIRALAPHAAAERLAGSVRSLLA
jgi:sugar phosphate isomerase/epimerase